MGKGKVFLVGAGPGDPELLTIKAHRVLSRAEVVLHDELVNPEILRFASPSTEIHNVGKRCGRLQLHQDEIHSKMVAFADQGLTVVRLKGGDPLLFGRAGEEMDALCRAGVDFEVVPGISAAFGAAASARIPLTDRRLASRLLFLSNRLCTGKGARIERDSISADTTIVVYMPGTDYGEVAKNFCDAGLAPDTCCLVVSQATTNEQQVLESALDRLAITSALPAPALLIVGRVAGLYSGPE